MTNPMDAITSSPGQLAAYMMLAFLLLATAGGQVAFKHYHHSGRRSSLFIAIVLFVCAPPVAILAVRQLGIGTVYVLMSLSYGLVALLGRRLFDEQISRRQLQGLALITLGCLLYAI